MSTTRTQHQEAETSSRATPPQFRYPLPPMCKGHRPRTATFCSAAALLSHVTSLTSPPCGKLPQPLDPEWCSVITSCSPDSPACGDCSPTYVLQCTPSRGNYSSRPQEKGKGNCSELWPWPKAWCWETSPAKMSSISYWWSRADSSSN